MAILPSAIKTPDEIKAMATAKANATTVPATTDPNQPATAQTQPSNLSASNFSKGLVSPSSNFPDPYAGLRAMKNFPAKDPSVVVSPAVDALGRSIANFGKGLVNTVTTGNPQGSGTSASAPDNPVLSAPAVPNTVFSDNHTANGELTAPPAPAPGTLPVNGALTTKLPNGGSVTTYQPGFGPSAAAVADTNSRLASIPSSAPNTINGVPSDQANANLSAELQKRGILEPGSPAALVNKALMSTDDLLAMKAILDKNPNPSNRVPVTPDPNVTTLPDGTTFNRVTGQQLTNAALAPKYNGPAIANTKAAEQASFDSADGGGVDSKGKPILGYQALHQQFQDQRAAYEDKTAAQRALDDGNHALPNGDPVHDAGIAHARALAIAKMAAINGEDPKDPKVLAKYTVSPGSFQATGSTNNINDLTHMALTGTNFPNLINEAIAQNSGGSIPSRVENNEALKQATGQEGLDYRADLDNAKQTNLDLRKQVEENKSANSPKASAAKTQDNLAMEAQKAIDRIYEKSQGPLLPQAQQRVNELEQEFQERTKKASSLRGESPDDVALPTTTTANPTKAVPPPAVGTVENGFKFKGGDPKDKANWEKI